MKKILALVLAMLLVLGMTSALAADIVINNVVDGQTYKAFQILNYSKDGDLYEYSLPAAQTNLKEMLTADGFEFVKSQDNSKWVLTNAEALSTSGAAAIVTALKDDLDSDDNLPYYLAKEEVTASGTTAKFTTLGTGYYFVTSTTGTLCTLGSLDDVETLFDKNEGPSLDKQVKGGSASTYVQTGNNASVGDTLTYKIDVTIHPGATLYTLTDDLGNGLQLQGTASNGLTVTASPAVTGTYADNYYTVTAAKWNTTKDDSSFEVVFNNDWLASLSTTVVVTVEYEAVITDSALTLSEVDNTATLTYGPKSSTITDNTETYLYKFRIEKIDGNTNQPLPGVKFTVTDASGKYYDGSTVWTSTETKLETAATTGLIEVNGIKEGTYTVTETDPLADYNPIDGNITVQVTSTGVVTVSGAATATTDGNGLVTITVVNNKGSVLPSTGGIGTTLFYVGGGILVLLAVIFLVTKRRMSSND